MCGKLAELHFDAKLSPNGGETVLECEKVTWTQDLRVQHTKNPLLMRVRKHK